MKVLMVNGPQALRFRGGDLTQMRKTAEALRPFGVEVSESFDPEPDARGFDLAHVFNLRTIGVTPGQVKHLKRAGVPTVLSPIYLNPSLPLWATSIIATIFGTPREAAELAKLLGLLKSYELKGARPDGQVFAAMGENRDEPDYDRLQRETLAQVDHLLPNSILEIDRLVKTLRVFQLPFTVVPYAADASVFLDPDPAPFVERYGLRDFVLQVGRIEPSKNQVLLAYALRDAGLRLVFIGQALDPDYLASCRAYGPKDLTVLPHLPPEELRSAYAAARVHVLPSWIETCGLVTMEAALANCNVVASIAGYEMEYYRDLPYYCDPADPESIRSAVQEAFANFDRDAGRRSRLKQLILSEYTWERAARATYQGYSQVVRER
jgi:glycosyltransferase involved in cell wall biosynthesis